MTRSFALSLALFAMLVLQPAPSRAGGEDAQPYLTAQDLDLRRYLPPPPPDDAMQTKKELGELLSIQVTRTPEMEARAQADVTENVWRFANVMGPNFTADKLPKTAAFFERVAATEGAVVDPAKDSWKRLRPHQLSKLVQPAVKLSNSGAWPSGHSTFGTLTGIVLANLVPEKRAAIMDRAWEFGENRIVGGMHYRSDVEVGRIAGSLIAAALMDRDDFKRDYAAVQEEMKTISGR